MSDATVKTVHSNEEIVRRLKEWFGKKLDHEVIECVAYECNYDVMHATNQLIDISKDVKNHPEKRPAPPPETKPPKIQYTREKLLEINRQFCNGKPPKPSAPTKTPHEEALQRIVEDGRRGVRILVLLRGLPGSGKSHLARQIVTECIGACDTSAYVLSADDYFKRQGGVYRFDPTQLSDAHKWNQSRARQMLYNGVSPVVVDNTNTQTWEMRPYLFFAVENSYVIEILEPATEWAFDDKELARRNVHGVPRAKIREMRERYERDITVAKLFEQFGLCYRKLPPQPRNYPALERKRTEMPIVNGETEKGEIRIVNGETEKMEETQPNGASDVAEAIEKAMDLISFDDASEKPDAWCPIESTLQSWDLIPNDVDSELAECKQTQQPAANLVDAETMTDYTDWGNPFSVLNVVYGKGNFVGSGTPTPKYPRHGLFDKGTMTDDDKVEIQDTLGYLSSLFEDVPPEYLADVYDKCNGDLDWTIDILLADDKKVLISDYVAPTVKSKTIEPVVEVVEEKVEEVEVKSSPVVNSEERLALKQQIESSVVIGKEHYTKNMLKLKGLSVAEDEAAVPSTSTSEPINLSSESDTEDDSDDSHEDMMELNLPDDLVAQLEAAFGGFKLDLPEGVKKTIEIPSSLGMQLYAVYLESVFKQTENYNTLLKEMIKEDERFALKLQEQELQQESAATPDLRQIMNDQREESKMMKRLSDEWKNLTPDDIAYRLTKQKLFSSFPSYDSEILLEILVAHGNCYNDTVEAIIASGGVAVNSAYKDPPLAEATLNEMKEAYEFESSQMDDTAVIPSTVLRAEAQKLRTKQRELLQKANGYFTRGMPEVALFYSNLARKQTVQYERYNALAAEVVLAESFDRLQSFSTIDLHNLHVKEAINALDRFIDFNVRCLNDENRSSQYVHIITGRGRNSPGGIPRIRPAIKQRLKKRGISFEQVNGGLLRAKIQRNSVMTTSMT